MAEVEKQEKVVVNGGKKEEEEEEFLLEGMSALDFDMLSATSVAFSGCGKVKLFLISWMTAVSLFNLPVAPATDLGRTCGGLVSGFVFFRENCFLYLSVAFIASVGAYLGFFRTRIKRKFNIRGNDSSLDDCVYHLICPCCTLSQESRTLEMNNVQDGTWHGRGDICIGSYAEGSKPLFELHPPPPMSIKTSGSQNSLNGTDNA
ncbi:hypothetical protein V6N12_070977 [Hibiscus sabdariffa]|uniref:Uncharacterized protein n=1 Tax=Hibiscus sabdariffa TaxID=183260 RepID=A0ABR2FIH1_9ROSI